MKKIMFVIAMVCGASAGLQANDGDLDLSFGGGTGFINIPATIAYGFSTAIQTDGKIVVTGANASNVTMTTRYHVDGTIDTAFGTNGIVTDITGINVADVLLQPDGKIVIAGADAAYQNVQLIRYNADGTLDTTFGSSGVVTGPTGNGYALAIQADGKIILVGTDNVAALFVVIRYNIDGSVDTVFQQGPGEFGTGIAIQSDGKVIVAGYSSSYTLVLVRYNADGTLDNSFVAGAAPAGIWGPVVLQQDGKIVAAGNALDASAMELVRFNTDGSVDTSFGGGVITGPAGIANHMILQADGKSVIMGAPTFNGPSFQLVRYTSTGILDTTFGSGGIVQAPAGIVAFSGAVQADGKIIAVGSDSTFSTIEVARYSGGPALIETQIQTITSAPSGDIVLSGVAQNPSNIYIFLNDVLIGGTTTDSQGTNTWSLTVPNVSGVYTAVSIYQNGSLDPSSMPYPDPSQTTVTSDDRMWLK